MNEKRLRMAGDWTSHLLKWEADEYHCMWTIWEVSEQDDGELLVHDEAATDPLHPGPDPLPYMRGTLKWDGCVDLDFPGLSEGGCMLHFCGPESAPLLGRLMAEVYALGPEIPNWHGEKR